jgi:hypothetical protein
MYVFDLEIEVKGKKRTILLVLCFPKQNTEIIASKSDISFTKKSFLVKFQLKYSSSSLVCRAPTCQ